MDGDFDFDKIRLPPEMDRPGRKLPASPRQTAMALPRASKTAGHRHIGCPFWWFRLALAAVKSKDQLAIALYIYRRSAVCKSATVKITNEKLLEDLGLGRGAKYRTLKCLAAAKLISYEVHGREATLITIVANNEQARG
jgi:hypothetical protein